MIFSVKEEEKMNNKKTNQPPVEEFPDDMVATDEEVESALLDIFG